MAELTITLDGQEIARHTVPVITRAQPMMSIGAQHPTARIKELEELLAQKRILEQELNKALGRSDETIKDLQRQNDCQREALANTLEVNRQLDARRKELEDRCVKADRLWERVDRSGGPDACWLWTGCQCKPGKRTGSRGVYGQIRDTAPSSKMLKVHRVVLTWKTGENPPDKEAGHQNTCVSGLCCNPAHLRWVTREENQQDWMLKHSTKELVAMAAAAAIEEIDHE